MQIDQTTSGPATVLSLTGDLDSFSVNYLKERLTRLFDDGVYRIVINLTHVDFIDSAGLGQLVSALKICYHHSGGIVLVGPNETIIDLLRITKLKDVFKVAESVEDAATLLEE